jgi:hypothetical protein
MNISAKVYCFVTIISEFRLYLYSRVGVFDSDFNILVFISIIININFFLLLYTFYKL